MDKTIPKYEFGAIPDQRLWVGESNQLTFQVTTQELDPNAELSMLVIGENLANQITLDPETGVFVYDPDEDDINPFEVIFQATVGSNGSTQEHEQRVRITPLPRLPAERHIVDDSSRPPTRSLYTTVEETDGQNLYFNAAHRDTKQISVQGIQVVYDPGSLDHSLAIIEGREDIYSLDINADVVIIRQRMHVPGTNVTIKARELRFEGSGQINTTPTSKAVPAPSGNRNNPNNPVPGSDGAHGNHAGNITLSIDVFHVPPGNMKRFILDGAKGQDAGQGMDGEDHGNEVMESWSSYSVTIDDTRIYYSGTGAPIVFRKTHWDYSWSDDRTDRTDTKGEDRWPANGGNAVPPGRPGNGGNGGVLLCNLDEKKLPDSLISIEPGQAGRKARDAYGGRHGQPYPCRKLELTVDQYDKAVGYYVWSVKDVKWTNCPPRTNGTNAAAPSGHAGQQGHIDRDFSSSGSAWLPEELLPDVVRYIRDAYLSNNRDLVRQYLEMYGAAAEQWLKMTASPLSKAMIVELAAMRNRLENRLDYFGNPAGWTPLLSIQANLRAYDNEVDRAMRALFLSYWVEHVKTDKTKLVAGLKTSIENLEQDIDASVEQIKELQDAMPDMQGMVDSLNNSITNTNNRLADLTAELKTKAHKTVEQRHQEQFMAEFGAAMLGGVTSVIPYGQPALGAAGQVGSSLIVSQYRTPEETQAEITGALTSAAGAQLESQAEDMIDAADPEMTEGQKKAKARAGKMMHVAENLGPAITSITDSFQHLGAPAEEVEAELALLAAENPEYQQMTGEIRELNARKVDFNNQLTAATQTITAGYNRMAANALAINEFENVIASQQQLLDPVALQHIEEMRQRALEVLQRYQYYLIKSYEATWLKPYKGGNFQLDLIFKKIEDLLDDDKSQDGVLPVEEFNQLRAIFTDIMDEMVRRLLEDLRPEYETTQWLTLSYEDTPHLMQQINEDGEAHINLMDLGLLLPDYENVRLADITVETEDGIVLAHGQSDQQGTLHLDFTLSGDGTIRSDGKLFVVRHPTTSGLGYDAHSQLRWGVTYDVKRGHLERTRPSSAFVSLLRYMLKDESQAGVNEDQLNLLSQPAAWTDIVISKSVTNARQPIDLTELTLKIRLTYLSAPRNQCVLNVSTRGGHKPLIQCSQRDRNHRAHGYGSLYRIFSRHTRVTLSAPADYGRLQFSHWEVLHTDTLHKEEVRTPTHTFEMDDNLTVVCVYSDGSLPQRPALAIGKRGRVKAGKGNNLRSAPSTEGERIGGIPAGGEFEVVGGPAHSVRYTWWQVDYNGQVGWTAEGLDGEYWLEVIGEQGVPRVSSLGRGKRARVAISSGINVRQAASTGAQRIGSLVQGNEFLITDGPVIQDGYTWWQIKHEDLSGWIASGQKGSTSWIEPA